MVRLVILFIELTKYIKKSEFFNILNRITNFIYSRIFIKLNNLLNKVNQ